MAWPTTQERVKHKKRDFEILNLGNPHYVTYETADYQLREQRSQDWIDLIDGGLNLSFAKQRVAHDIKKTVQSAVANAENNNQYDIDNLYIKEAYVGKSLVMKRFRPRAKGRASPIKKPFSRITIVLSERKEEKNGPKN